LEQVRLINPEFFQAMGLQLKQGRSFERKDVDNHSNLIIVNQAFAKRYLSGKDPLTSSILLNVVTPHPEKVPVIGVVSDARDLGVETQAEPVLYLAGFGVHAVVLIRTKTDPKGIPRRYATLSGTSILLSRSITSRPSMRSSPILSRGKG
jgi:hypothetical protein